MLYHPLCLWVLIILCVLPLCCWTKDAHLKTREEDHTTAGPCNALWKSLSVTNDDDDTTLLQNLPKSSSSSSSLSVFDQINFAIHRNGDSQTCGFSPSSVKAIQSALESSRLCSSNTANQQQHTHVRRLDKFQVESFLTDLFANELSTGPRTCLPSVVSSNKNNQQQHQGLYGYCDRGADYTVVQNDHSKLVKTRVGSLPCRFYTREGKRIHSLLQFIQLSRTAVASQSNTANTTTSCSRNHINNNDDDEEAASCETLNTLHLYVVPASRYFLFAPSFVGETFRLDHVQDTVNGSVVLEVLSVHPRVLEVHNFFTPREADGLIQNALLQENTGTIHAIQRSLTGSSTNKEIDDRRTSDNAWDEKGDIAMRIKRRCFETIGIDEYHESNADGLQIVRYSNSQAYAPHSDYHPETTQRGDYDYNSAGKGGNRFATVLLYLNDVGEKDGGETMFQNAWPSNLALHDRIPRDKAIANLRESGEYASYLKQGSWEEEMTALCQTRLAVRPRKGRAILFYSQYPDGQHDVAALHGGCPVVHNATKWLANLWVWSAPRRGYEQAPMKKLSSLEEVAASHTVIPTKASNVMIRIRRNT